MKRHEIEKELADGFQTAFIDHTYQKEKNQ